MGVLPTSLLAPFLDNVLVWQGGQMGAMQLLFLHKSLFKQPKQGTLSRSEQ